MNRDLQEAGRQGRLDDGSALAFDAKGHGCLRRRGGRPVADHFHRLGALVEQTDVVVGRVRGAEGAVADELVQEGPSLLSRSRSARRWRRARARARW